METITTEETELQSLMHMVRSQLPDISQAANLIEQVEVGSAVLLEVLDQHGVVNGVEKELRGLALKLEGHPANNISLVRVLSMLTAVVLSLLQDKIQGADKTPLPRKIDSAQDGEVHSGSPSSKYASTQQTSQMLTPKLAVDPSGPYPIQKSSAVRISAEDIGKRGSATDSPRFGFETVPVRSHMSPPQAQLPFSRPISAVAIPSSRPSATSAHPDAPPGRPGASGAPPTYLGTHNFRAHDLPYYHGASVDDATPIFPRTMSYGASVGDATQPIFPRTMAYRPSQPSASQSRQGSHYVMSEPMAEPTIENAGDRGIAGMFTLGTGMWGTMYCESQGERRQAFDLLARTGIISNKELAENASSVALEHVDDCLHIAREMLSKYSIDIWVANAAGANQHFQGRLATLYAERYSTPADEKPPRI
eukprot:GEMP01037728.1.p1 GENE.GEMP01037728.1~~GEMP01037728.1.p1  ORF type:complete len:421 (+),score=91.33 GEMP01037728.1:66-1328(+)